MQEYPHGVALIEEERIRQFEKGYTLEKDDRYDEGQLRIVAMGVLSGAHDAWGILKKHEDDRIQQLVIAGALIAAEIDRLMRLKEKEGK